MEIVEEDRAPGRKVMRRKSGRIDVYWVASKEARDAGFEPKTVTLTDDPGATKAPPEVAARCRRMWAEMLEFVAGRMPAMRTAPYGTIAWLADLYQTDEESPYHAKRQSTREGYDKSLTIIRSTVGERRIDAVTAKDVRKWFRQWGRADDDGKLANPRRAYGCVQLLRIIVKHGKGLRNAACRELSQILTETEFPTSRGRKQAMSESQAVAFIAAAHELKCASIARAVAIQYCCALRQKDVIGEWIRTSDKKRWDNGLRWGEHIKSDWRLEKPTSKSNFTEVATFDLRLIPMVMTELQAIPATSRIGPVIIDESTGLPYAQRKFARTFRKIAQKAGIPDEVWNMDARAGAITDAYNKGAQPADAMDLATHTQMATNLKYKRGRIAATNRIAKVRFGDKNED